MRFLESAAGGLRAVACLILLPPGLLILSAGAIVRALAGGSPRECHVFYQRFAELCLLLAGTDLEVRGLENVDPDRAYVVVSNHESNWDAVAILKGLPVTVRFVAKAALMRIPVFGHALAMTGNVRVNRSRGSGDVRRVQAVMAERHPEVSILFFAEGTRSREGAFRSFKKGAFATAIQEKLPILPIAVGGTYSITKPESPIIHKGSVVLEIGRPIPIDGHDYDRREELRDHVHEVVGELRDRARRRLRDKGVEPGGAD